MVRLDPSDRSFHRSGRSEGIHGERGGDSTSTYPCRHGVDCEGGRHEERNNTAVEGIAFVESPGYIPSTLLRIPPRNSLRTAIRPIPNPGDEVHDLSEREGWPISIPWHNCGWLRLR